MNELNLIEEATVNVVTQELNLNSLTVANQDFINLGGFVANGARTINFKFTPTSTINSGTATKTIISYYKDGTEADRVNLSFFSGRLGFSIRVGLGTISGVTSNSNLWVAGTTYDISLIVDPVSGMRMLVDNVLQTSTNSSTLAPVTNSGGYVSFGGNDFYNIRYIDATFSNLQFWSTARTISQNLIDKDTVPSAGEAGLIECFPFTDETGFTVTGIKGNAVTISTLNAGGVTYVDSTVRVDVLTPTTIDTLEKKNIDLFEGQFVSVTKQAFNVNNIAQRLSGVTNNFTLPFTANNSQVFDYLDNNGSLSNKPYQINYVEYIQDGTPIIKRGRLNIKEISEGGYKVDVTHGINDFFDRIRDKQFYEAFEDRSPITLSMSAASIQNLNVTTVFNQTGFIFPLASYFQANPLPEYQLTPYAIVSKAFEFITEDVGYTFVDNTNGRIEGKCFGGSKLFEYSEEKQDISTTLNLSGIGDTTVNTYYTKKRGVIFFQFSLRYQVLSSLGLGISITVFIDGVPTIVYATSPVTNNVVTDFTTIIDTGSTIYPIGTKIETIITISSDPNASLILSFGEYNPPNTSFVGVKASSTFYPSNSYNGLTQLEFITYIFELFNLAFEVNETNKQLIVYSLNDVYNPNIGSTIDFSTYYSNVMTKDFQSDYGKSNSFKYKYLEGRPTLYDSSFLANNTNKDKTVIDSSITASFHDQTIDLTGVTPFILKANGYEDATLNAKSKDIGFRVLEYQILYDQFLPPTLLTPQHVQVFGGLSVDYLDYSGVTQTGVYNVVAITNSERLDWSNLIEDNYSSLRDFVLNRYQELKVLMRVPRYIIDDCSFKNKIYISQLNSKFVVQSIKTRPDGLSEWILIKLN